MEMNKGFVAVILVIALIAVGAYIYVNAFSTAKTVSVSGISELKSEADFVSIYFSVETLNESAQKSQDENFKISNEVIGALEDLGIKVETQNVNTYQEYDWSNNARELKGYKTVHSIRAEIENPKLAGFTIDKAAEKGALVRSINFEITQEHENELKAQALEEATRDARTKAEAIAKGSGGKLGKLVSISTNDYNYYPYMAYSYAEGDSVGMAKDSVAEVAPRDINVRANVNAVYQIR